MSGSHRYALAPIIPSTPPPPHNGELISAGVSDPPVRITWRLLLQAIMLVFHVLLWRGHYILHTVSETLQLCMHCGVTGTQLPCVHCSIVSRDALSCGICTACASLQVQTESYVQHVSMHSCMRFLESKAMFGCRLLSETVRGMTHEDIISLARAAHGHPLKLTDLRQVCMCTQCFDHMDD